VLRATRLLHEHHAESLTLETLARSAGCSRTTLKEQLARTLGTTPSGYSARLRVNEAANRLRQSGDAIDDVARGVGCRRRLQADVSGPMFSCRYGPSAIMSRRG
jgi:AraC-like DNA-binding protein